MKTTCVTALSLLLVTACSFGADPSAAPAPAPVTSPPPAPAAEPAAPPLDGAPETSELTEAFGVFVAEHGTTDGDGSRARPLRSVQAAIDAASAAHKRVYVCAGTYPEAIVLRDGLPMVGDLSCGSSTWTVGDARARIVSPRSPAVRAVGIASPTRLEGFEFDAPDAVEPSASSIALLANDSPGLTIARSRLVAGRGADGKPGTDGVQLVTRTIAQRGNGYAAGLYPCNMNTGCGGFGYYAPVAGGVGGASACDGAPGHDPEAGGHGGTGGVWQWTNGGWNWYAGNIKESQQPGEKKSGAAGARGVDGASAAAGAFSKDDFAAGDGAPGTDGLAGHGGSGGDGVYPGTRAPNDFSEVWQGNGGGGGGAGGCPGLAGTPGTGGGASVGALLWNSPVAFVATEIVSGHGGAGGAGTFGSDATHGENGGIGYAAGSTGQNGGDGGEAGVSGSGAGGPSFAIAHHGGAPTVDGDSKATLGKGGDGVPEKTTQTQIGFGKTIAASSAGAVEAVHALP